LSYEAFYHDYAARAYAPRHAQELSGLLRELEAMGPRWTGSWGQWECRAFEWIGSGNPLADVPDSRPNPVNTSRLLQIRGRLSEMLSEVSADRQPAGMDRLRWLISTIDWLVQYDRVSLLMEPGGPFERRSSELYVGDAHGNSDHSQDEDAWELLRRAPLGDAMLTYARKIESRGELGVLATINVKAYSTVLDAAYKFGLHRGNWPPATVRARGTDHSAVAEWAASPSATGYRVWRRLDGHGEWTCLTAEPIKERRFEDGGLSPGEYEYAVTSVAPPILESLRSFGAKARVGRPVAPPLVQVLSPPSILWADDRLILRCIVTGDREVSSVKLHHRALDGRELPSLELRPGRGSTYRIEVPLRELAGQVLLYGIEAFDTYGQSGVWPTGHPTVSRSLSVIR